MYTNFKYHIRMPDIQEAKCFEFTVQILPPPLDLFLYTPLSLALLRQTISSN